LRPNTITLRTRVLRRLEIHAGKSLLRVTIDDLRAFLDRLDDQGSRAAERTQIRSFYKWAALEGYVRDDPSFRLEPIRKRKYLPRPIDDGLLALALSDPPERVRPMLWLAAYAGLRAHDIAQLRGEHLMWDRVPPMIFVEDSKGGKSRTVPMAPQVMALRTLLPAYGWCFPYRDGRAGHITAQYVSKLCNDYLHSLGITETLHQLRHWSITEVYQASGRDLLATQDFAGHENATTTQIYAWVDPGLVAEAVGRMRGVVGDGTVSSLRVAG
jgi:integrase/recombinase XerD